MNDGWSRIFATALRCWPVLLLGVFLAGCAEAEQPRYPDLWDSTDPELQTALEQMLAGMPPGFMKAVTPEHHQMIAEIFSKPAIQHKFVKGMRDQPDAEVFRKSGTWKQFHSDSGIVTRPDMEYIVVVLADHEGGGEALVELIVAIDKLMLERHAPPE